MKAKVVSTSSKKQRPAENPEDRQKQIIALTIDRVEERIRNGTASSAEYVHFLKLASDEDRLKKEKLEGELALLRAKTEALESSKKSEEMYEEAIKAMRLYAGSDEDDIYDEDV